MRKRPPKLCEHKRSGRAFVTDPATGEQVPMGAWGSAEATRNYAAWLEAFAARSRETPGLPPAGTLAVDQLVESFRQWAAGYYVKRGKVTSEVKSFDHALGHVRRLYGTTPAAAFGPAALKAVREAFVAAGWARKVCNRQTGRVRQVWKWAAERELLPGDVWQSLRAVAPLKKGRTPAPESAGVPPADPADVEAVLPFLSAKVSAMARVQLLAGMRPGEVRVMRPRDLTAEGGLWRYAPGEHKTEHHEKDRTVWLGPKAQALLLPWRVRCAGDDAPLFPGRGGAPLSGTAYQCAVYRGCAKATAALGRVVKFAPRQLRATALTEVRRVYGLDAAQVVAGHSTADVTQVYTQRQAELAKRAAAELG